MFPRLAVSTAKSTNCSVRWHIARTNCFRSQISEWHQSVPPPGMRHRHIGTGRWHRRWQCWHTAYRWVSYRNGSRTILIYLYKGAAVTVYVREDVSNGGGCYMLSTGKNTKYICTSLLWVFTWFTLNVLLVTAYISHSKSTILTNTEFVSVYLETYLYCCYAISTGSCCQDYGANDLTHWNFQLFARSAFGEDVVEQGVGSLSCRLNDAILGLFVKGNALFLLKYKVWLS